METQKTRWWRRTADSAWRMWDGAVAVAQYRPQATSIGRHFSTRELGIALALTIVTSAAISLTFGHTKDRRQPPVQRKTKGDDLSARAKEYRAAFESASARLGDLEALRAKGQPNRLEGDHVPEQGAE